MREETRLYHISASDDQIEALRTHLEELGIPFDSAINIAVRRDETAVCFTGHDASNGLLRIINDSLAESCDRVLPHDWIEYSQDERVGLLQLATYAVRTDSGIAWEILDESIVRDGIPDHLLDNGPSGADHRLWIRKQELEEQERRIRAELIRLS